jgi:hypothetical protein
MNDSPRSSNDDEEFDPYANLPPIPTQTTAGVPSAPSENDRELYSFVDRFRSLVSQINREAEDGAYIGGSGGSSSSSTPPSAYLSDPTIRAVVGYDEFGRPYPPDDHVRILNSYIRRMPTIESIGSREMTAGTSVAASSIYQEQRECASLHTLSRPPTRAMTDRDRDGYSEPPSRAGSLSLAAVELINAMGGVEGLPELVDRVRRNGSIGSTGSQSGGTAGTNGTNVSGTSGGTAGTNVSGTSYFSASASPLHTPVLEQPPEGLPLSSQLQSQSLSSSPSLPTILPRPLRQSPIQEEPPDGHELPSPASLPPPPRALRPLPRPPGLARADSV